MDLHQNISIGYIRTGGWLYFLLVPVFSNGLQEHVLFNHQKKKPSNFLRQMEGVSHYTMNFSRRLPILLKRNWPCRPGSHGARPQVVSVWVVFSYCTKCLSQGKREMEKERGFSKGTGPLIYKSLVRCLCDFMALKGSALLNYQVSDNLWLLVKLSDTPWKIKSVSEGGCQDPSPRLDPSLSKPPICGLYTWQWV